MKKKEDKNTRFFLDVDLKEQKILGWDYDQKEKLILDKISEPHIHRIFLTKGQYNKLSKRQEDYLDSIAGNVF
jgi:hypothetical protein